MEWICHGSIPSFGKVQLANSYESRYSREVLRSAIDSLMFNEFLYIFEKKAENEGTGENIDEAIGEVFG